MVFVLLSPAKSMRVPGNGGGEGWEGERGVPDLNFPSSTQQLITSLVSLGVAKTKTLLKVSAGLAGDAFDGHSSHGNVLSGPQDEGEGIPLAKAWRAFSGTAYQALDGDSLDADVIARIEHSLRILDGIYGVVRGGDMVGRHRMDMGTKISGNALPGVEAASLYAFWGDKIGRLILDDAIAEQQESGEKPLVINCASDEYYKAAKAVLVDAAEEGKIDLVHVGFKTGGKAAGVYSKSGRGAVARFVGTASVSCLDDLLAFDSQGYSFSESQSDLEGPVKNVVFIRASAPAPKRKASSKKKASAKRKTKKQKKL